MMNLKQMSAIINIFKISKQFSIELSNYISEIKLWKLVSMKQKTTLG